VTSSSTNSSGHNLLGTRFSALTTARLHAGAERFQPLRPS
jgi:hypothetical protein